MSTFVSSALVLAALTTSLALASCSQSTECEESDCVCLGMCRCLPGDELTADTLDVRPLYTVDGIPVVVLRLDLAGQCFGEGERTFVVYRTSSLEISSGPVDVDDFRAPRHVPDSFAYEYMDVTIEVRSTGSAGTRIQFVDPSGTNPTLTAECDGTSGILSCTQL